MPLGTTKYASMEPEPAMPGTLPFPERKLTKFLIMFDNSNLLYFPGQFLSGRVIVELQDEMAITGETRLKRWMARGAFLCIELERYV